MDRFLSWNFFWLMACSFVGQSHQKPFLSSGPKLIQSKELYANNGKTNIKFSPTLTLPTAEMPPTQSHLPALPLNLDGDKDGISSTSDVKSTHPSPSKDNKDTLTKALSSFLLEIGSNEVNANPTSIRGLDELSLAVRFRRSLGRYRSRCCYMDVMCSRGCRRRPRRRSQKARTEVNVSDQEGLNLDLPQTDDMDASATISERPSKRNETESSQFPVREGRTVNTLQSKKGIKKRNDKLAIFSPTGEDNSRSESENGRFSKRNPTSNHSFKSRTTEKVRLSMKWETKADVLSGLPQILDSLEYLMKNNFPV